MIKETGIILSEVLEMDIMKNCRLIAGEDAKGNVITRVNIMADPDVLNWVMEGEFLLTTAYFFKITSLEEQKKLICEASDKKLSGIGIKVIPYLEKLPEEIIHLANELLLPIVELDSDIPFGEIMTPIFREIFNRQSVMLQKVENVHNDTMDVILKGGGVKEIVRVLMRSVENPVLIKDHYFEEYIYDEQDSNTDYSELIKSVKKYFKTSSNHYRHVKKSEDRVPWGNDYVDRVMLPIMIRNNIHGHMVICGTRRKITSFDILNLESALAIIALEFLKRISVQEVENKYKAEFFEDLISLDERRKEKATERANYYRLQKNAWYSVLTIHLDEAAQVPVTSEELNQTLGRMIYLIDASCRTGGRIYLIANKGNNVNVLFMWEDSQSYEREIRQMADGIERLLEQKMAGLDFRIGIGRPCKGIELVWHSLRDAEKAVEAARAYIGERIVEFEKLGIYKIFCQEHLKDELQSFYNSTLKDLVDYDRKRDTEMVKTLQVYFETNGNLKRMSELLFTHYNTILYRINRIQEITSKNLESENDRYGLQTALKIMDILSL